MTPRPCIGYRGNGCQALTPRGPRCPACQAQWETDRNASPHRQHLYAGDWDRRARQAITNYRATHGDTCPGWGTPPHLIPPNAWTCDHDLGPLCRSCNSRKAGATETPHRRGTGRDG